MTDAQRTRQQHWAALGAELRRLRNAARKSQDDLATALSVSKSTINRIETGGTYGGAAPSVQRALAWARECSASTAELELVRTLAELALGTPSPYQEWGTMADIQERVLRDEATAMTMLNFSNWGIPGLLQTPEYASSVLRLADLWDGGGAEDAAAKRMRRQAILSDPRRKLEFVVTEAALRWRPGPVPVLQGQLAYLTAVASWPTVTLGVIPDGAEAHALPMNPFVLFEDRLDGEPSFADVEMAHKNERVVEPDQVAIYRKLYELLRETAVMGEEAAAILIRRVAESLS
jgi:transcriptional regulator with XRE-family HTH domain